LVSIAAGKREEEEEEEEKKKKKSETYASENWMMRPFFDQPIQFGPSDKLSDLVSILATFTGLSASYGLATLQTLRSLF
jgi:choline-glycine betaine transporter